MDCSPPGSTPWFSRQEYWSGLPFPSLGDLSRVWTRVCWISGRFFTVWVSNQFLICLPKPNCVLLNTENIFSQGYPFPQVATSHRGGCKAFPTGAWHVLQVLPSGVGTSLTLHLCPHHLWALGRQVPRLFCYYPVASTKHVLKNTGVHGWWDQHSMLSLLFKKNIWSPLVLVMACKL